jgi:hypothetical protein
MTVGKFRNQQRVEGTNQNQAAPRSERPERPSSDEGSTGSRVLKAFFGRDQD